MGLATIVNMTVFVCVPAWGPWAITLAWYVPPKPLSAIAGGGLVFVKTCFLPNITWEAPKSNTWNDYTLRLSLATIAVTC